MATAKARSGDCTTHRAAATRGGGTAPALPCAAATQVAPEAPGGQPPVPGWTKATPPLAEPADEVAAPPTLDATAADLGATGTVEVPVTGAVVAAALGRAGVGGAVGLGDGDGGGGGALTVYGADAWVPLMTAPFWTKLPQTEYCAGVFPAGG
jgi:hypothetical protein